MTDPEFLATAIVAGSGALTITAKGIISILRRITRSQDQATAALLESARTVARFNARMESFEKSIERLLSREAREARPANRRTESRMRETKPMRTIARDPRSEPRDGSLAEEPERSPRPRGRARAASEDAPEPVASERSERSERAERSSQHRRHDPDRDLEKDRDSERHPDPRAERNSSSREFDRESDR